jgi:predicted lipoprotein with Yx(FWY)xxD motif
MKGVFTKGLIVALVACATAMSLGAESIQVQTSAKGVSYLTDSAGMTLYYYTMDANGQSACYGKCASAWPIFYAENTTVSGALSAADFGTITRTDGTKQTTYKGWPLYYWFKDKKAGDMTGEGVGKVWYVLTVPSYTVMMGTSSLGNYLVDGAGNTLYWYTKDSVGQSACTGNCLKAWPAFNPASFVLTSNLNAADFGVITRTDGGQQATYKGWPLYYWVKDMKRGDTTGQDVGKVWYVIDPEKFPPAKT